MTPKRERAIKRHINKAIKNFKAEIIQLCIENNHPYIEGVLQIAIIKQRENIRWNTADIKPNEFNFTQQPD